MPLLYITTISLVTILRSSVISNVISQRITRTCLFPSFILNCLAIHNPSTYIHHILHYSIYARRHLTVLNSSETQNIDKMHINAVIKDPLAHNFSPDPSFIAERLAYFQQLYETQQTNFENSEKQSISVELPNGTIVDATTATKPIEIISSFSKEESKKVIIAQVLFKNDNNEKEYSIDDDDEELTSKDGWRLWDLTRPLQGSCKLNWLTFDSQEGSKVFWHSSAHLLGYALEKLYGAYLGIGPPIAKGYYYDVYIGNQTLDPSSDVKIEKVINEVVSKNHPFQRLVCTKEEALQLMRHNPFKQELIRKKVPDGSYTSCYRCGDFIDLCMGPHLPSTGYIKSNKIMKFSSAYWLGDSKSDSMQRVYGVSFPDKANLNNYLKFLEDVKQRDHRVLGTNLGLFYLDSNESPGSCFWLPKGAKIYNRLIDFLRHQYALRDYHEVITPNIFGCDLWKKSGHYENYKDSMFLFQVEGKEWGMKPMNCPGHCILFKQMNLSYRQLPYRMADFGVLHRNELSGSLTGLVRVRRFQQDDAHIFCTPEQINEEITSILNFVLKVYGLFGFSCEFKLSTRPTKKTIGDDSLWATSESALELALNSLNLKWSLNPGDGAFYGPKIDVLVKDCLGRDHQCGTIQLDFNLPQRFNLEYRDSGFEESNEVSDDSKGTRHGWSRPVLIHRAIFGSLERFIAILLEQTNGKLPFWLNPSQVVVIPVADRHMEYAKEVNHLLVTQGFNSSVDSTCSTVNRKIRQAQLEQVGYMIVVGDRETEAKTVTLRSRDSIDLQKTMSLQDMVETFKELNKWPM